jgi:hypothetical protein
VPEYHPPAVYYASPRGFGHGAFGSCWFFRCKQ